MKGIRIGKAGNGTQLHCLDCGTTTFLDAIEKIELFNKLKKELESEYGGFDSIVLVDEYPSDAEMCEGQFYGDTNGCEESNPIVLYIKREV